MDIKVQDEWLRWGDVPTDYVGFFAPIEEAKWDGLEICVRNKYGEYRVDPKTQHVITVSGVTHDILAEVAKYGMGYKYWETGDRR